MLKITFVNMIVVALAVQIHYQFLFRISSQLPKLKLVHRHRMVIGVCLSLVAHAIEVWLFAFVYYFLHHADGWGYLDGNFSGTLRDCVYFSFAVYTTLGFGDIQANGLMRFVTGFEALTGLVLIAWTASYLYFELQRPWGASDSESTN